MELSPEALGKLEQIAKLPKGARIGIMVGIVIALGAGYYFGVYQGARGDLQRLRAKELELQRKLSEVRAVASNIGAFEEEITELEGRLTQVLEQLPNKKQLEVLLTDFSNLGKTAGVDINSFTRHDEVFLDFYAEVPISIEVVGTYHNIARFFDLMARLPRIVNMGALNIRVGSENSERTLLKVSGTATTFRFVAQEESA
jgi:type IV pilus assembly protein PilO